MTVTIDAGIGTIRATNDDSMKLQMLLESIKTKIEGGGLDDLIKYLDN